MTRSRRATAAALSRPVASPPRSRGGLALGDRFAALRRFGRRHRVPVAVAGSLATIAMLAYVLARHRRSARRYRR